MELRDPVSSASHLLAAVWAAYATLILIRLTPRRTPLRLAVAVFGTSMVLLYLASGIFHGLPFTKMRNPVEFRFFQRLDQSAIFLVIAGTNTPCLVGLIGGRLAKGFLWALWLQAAVGIVCLWLLPKPPHAVIVALCLGMGWFGVLPLAHYYRAVGWRAMNWVWAGAGFYTLGAICELIEWPHLLASPVRVGFHEVFHLCDMAGSLCFFLFVTRHVIPYEMTPRTPLSDFDEDEEPLAACRGTTG